VRDKIYYAHGRAWGLAMNVVDTGQEQTTPRTLSAVDILKTRRVFVFNVIKEKPLPAFFSLFILALLFLHLGGVVKVDGYAIALVFLALLPWSLSTWNAIFGAIGEALSKANIKSVQFGTFKIEQLERQVAEHSRILDVQREMLDDLILYSMAFYIYEKLKFLHLGSVDISGPYREYKYVKSDADDHDLRYLRDHGYLEMFYVRDLVPGENLVGKLKVTEMGKRFVELKETRQQQNVK
jgi:hypothetical protein